MNPQVGAAGAAALAAALRAAERLQTVVVGPKATRLPFRGSPDATALDLSDEDLGAAEAASGKDAGHSPTSQHEVPTRNV